MRLHLSDDVFEVWHAVQEETGDADAPIPFWAFAWGGGLAIASYLRDHPEVVADRRVLDMASGSGLCAIAAMRAGASEVTAVDIDPLSIAAIELNAKANRQRIDARREDLLADEPPPDVDLILAGDCWYEESFGHRIECVAATSAGSRDRRANWRPGPALPLARLSPGAGDVPRALDYRPGGSRSDQRLRLQAALVPVGRLGYLAQPRDSRLALVDEALDRVDDVRRTQVGLVDDLVDRAAGAPAVIPVR